MRAALACLVLISMLPFSGQALPLSGRLGFEANPAFMLPVAGSEDLFNPGAGASAMASLRFNPVFPFLWGAWFYSPSRGPDPLQLSEAGGGLGLSLGLGDRLGVRLFGGGGPYSAQWGDSAAWYWQMKGSFDIGFRLTPAFTLRLGGGYSHYLGPEEPFFRGLQVNLGASIGLAGFSSDSVSVSDLELDSIFPVFHTFYDRNPLGQVSIHNGEDGSIRDVKVSFLIAQYMNEPKLCATVPFIAQGGQAQVPVFALLSEDVLKLTESTKSGAELIVEYSFLGQKRQTRATGTVRVNHRNAMTWDDDRRAAAFVSAKDPAVLRYSKFAAGLVREANSTAEIDANLRIALGLFEGLGIYGLNYVIDPTTPYTELSTSASMVDFLQYPYQTLIYKGGDCDDLSIMFAAVLESVGIPTAFITVPGHIYMAFGLVADETAVRKLSFADDLIFASGKVWVPVEITLFNQGFSRAWQIGIREWREAGKEAALIPLAEAWKQYEPVGIPGEDTRIVLPSPEGIVEAYQKTLEAVVDRELGFRADKLKAEYVGRLSDARYLNSLGILYSRFGKLSEGKSALEMAVQAGSKTALANLGNIAFLSRDWKGASELFQRALEASPTNNVAMLGLARARYELGDLAESSRLLGAIDKIAPELAKSYAYLSGSASGTGRAAAAEGDPKLPWDEEK